LIKLEDLYSFIESNFEFLMAVDSAETVLHASRLLCRSCGPGELQLAGCSLESVLSPDSLESFREGMAAAKEGQRGIAIYSPMKYPDCSVPLKTGFVDSPEGEVYLLFGSQIDTMAAFTEGEKDERIKELACLYAVAEWIEISGSIPEFFNRLPDYLSKGMLYPEQAIVFSAYQGVDYGIPPSGRYISAKLVVNRQVSGEIRVGYASPDLDLLPEEQRMLSEITRMLTLALERKELRERIVLKQEEEASYAQKIAELQREIEGRTRQLDDQKQKLDTVNTYLEQVNRGWEESSSRLQSMFQAIPDDVAFIDVNRNIVMTNRKSFAPGMKCHKVFFDCETPCRDCRLARIKKEKAPISVDIPSGDRFLEVHAIPVLNASQEVEGIIEFYRDITLEKTYEQQLQQADKLASLGQLVSGIGHEINNPNQFIRGNIKILRQAMEDILPIVDSYAGEHPDLKIARLKYDFFRSSVLTLIDDMAHGSERIKGIVEGLRNFARKDEGLLIDNVDVNTIIQAAARLVSNEVHKHADIELQLDPAIPTLTGNAQKIEQVLINLLVNAGQAMPDERRGTVKVRTSTEPGKLVVEVSDDGKGMNDKTLKQIFDPFFTTKRAKGGTGLGLAIAYKILEEHGGTIQVASTPDVGTTFTLKFPVKSAAPAPVEGTQPATA
jgi:signal transduction histidine kinase